MTESAALLVDTVLPRQPIRQWVLSVPYPLRLLFASQPLVMGRALKIVYLTGVTSDLIKRVYQHKHPQARLCEPCVFCRAWQSSPSLAAEHKNVIIWHHNISRKIVRMMSPKQNF